MRRSGRNALQQAHNNSDDNDQQTSIIPNTCPELQVWRLDRTGVSSGLSGQKDAWGGYARFFHTFFVTRRVHGDSSMLLFGGGFSYTLYWRVSGLEKWISRLNAFLCISDVWNRVLGLSVVHFGEQLILQPELSQV